MCWAVRPEVLGVFLILCGVIFYCKWEFCKKESNVYFLLCALFLGLSITVSPNFTLVAGILTLFIIFKNIKEGFIFKSFLFSLVAFLPVLIVVWWFLAHYPESILQFMGGVQYTKKPEFMEGFTALFGHAFMLGGQLTSIKIVYVFYWFPLLFLLVAVPKLVFKNKMMDKQNTVYLLSGALYISIILHLSIIPGADTYFTIISFFAVLLFTINLKLERTILRKMSINRGLLPVLLISLMLAISSYSIVHSMKFLFSEKQYYYAPKTRSAVLNQLKSDDILFLNNGILIPPFGELFDMQFRGISDIRIYEVMPLYFSLNPEKGDKFLINKLTHILPEKTIWGTEKGYLTYNNGNSKIKMILRKYKAGGLKYVIFDNIEIVYEDKDYIFFRPNSISVS
jgi:hypothetical protein